MNRLMRLFGSPVAGIGPLEAQAKLNQKGIPFLLDVRRPEEFREGHIRGAKLIPLDELTARMNELPKDRPIICVCRSGNRSTTATRELAAAGYQAANLTGGMIAWTQAGLPVAKGSA